MTPESYALLQQLADPEILALTAFLEARSEPVQGIVAVMWTIRTRVAKRLCGHSISQVCLWPKQFSCWNDRDPNQALGLELAAQLLQGTSIAGVVDGIVLSTCLFLADRVLVEPPCVPDPSHQATHYLNPRTLARLPAWADPASGAEVTVTIGAHRFYRHVV